MLVSSALWAGAITPTLVVTQASTLGSLPVPQFDNSTMIREWPTEISTSGPLLRSSKGLFSFFPGVRMLGSLVASAASATTVDRGIRQYLKSDNTRYIYNGRSYGVGASVGLADGPITDNPLALSYEYQENGLRADVDCIYDLSTEFVIAHESWSKIYPVVGNLLNSGDSEEYSDYYERILGIAVCESYAALNATQCIVTFAPIVFNVFVSLSGRYINVTAGFNGVDFVTSLYVFVIGDSFTSSIASYNSSVTSKGSLVPLEASATLAGLTNSVTVMIDDFLVAYSSAQLMIMNDTRPVPVAVEINAFRYGSGFYIYLTFVVNITIVLLLVEEALRTRGWKGLLYFDYTDFRSLIIGGFMGGCAVANAAKLAWTDRIRSMYKYVSREVGDVRVALYENYNSLVLDSSRSQQKKVSKLLSHDK